MNLPNQGVIRAYSVCKLLGWPALFWHFENLVTWRPVIQGLHKSRQNAEAILYNECRLCITTSSWNFPSVPFEDAIAEDCHCKKKEKLSKETRDASIDKPPFFVGACVGTLVGAFVIRNTGAEVEVGTGVGTYFVGGAVSGKQFAVKQSGVPVGVPVGGSGVGCRVGSLDGCCVAPGGRVMVGASVCGRHDRCSNTQVV